MQLKTLFWLGFGMFLLGVGTSVVRHLMNAPMYEPGMVRKGFGTVYPPPPSSSFPPPCSFSSTFDDESDDLIEETDEIGKKGIEREGEEERRAQEMSEETREKQVEIQSWKMEEGIEIAWFSEGKKGGQPVLVLHGGPGIPPVLPWPFSQQLLDQFQFFYYHQRGCGQSTHPFDRFDDKMSFYEFVTTLDSTLGIAPQLADIERIRQIITSSSSPSSSLPFGGKKIILIGHSFGAFLATLYAAEFPENVEALILMTPADVLQLPSPNGGGLFELIKSKLPQERQQAYDEFTQRYLDFSALKTSNEKELVERHMEFLQWYGQVSPVPVPPALSQMMGKPGGWVTYALYLSMGRVHDFSPLLKQVSAPTLIIHGEQDLQPLAASASYRHIPQAHLVIMPNASHFPHLEDSVSFSSLIQLFLTEHQFLD